MTIGQFIELSIACGFIAYASLTVFFIVGWRRRITGRAALAASLLTTAWFSALFLTGGSYTTHLLEIASYVAWIGLLLRILGLSVHNLFDARFRVQSRFGLLALILGLGAALMLIRSDVPYPRSISFAKLGLCVLGLILIEQIVRNTRRNYQWSLKFIGIGLATMFGYGFFVYADATLFNAPRMSMLAPQPLVYAFAVPLLAIASLRNRSAPLSVNLSREFVFRSGMLIATGGYLLVMGAAGYYLRIFGGEWGDVLLVLVLATAVLTAVVLLFSTQFRSYVRMIVARNLYEQKYDYRDQWMRVTREISRRDPDATLGDAAIHALAGTIQTATGVLWRLTEELVFVPIQMSAGSSATALSAATTRSIVEFFRDQDWIVDLDEYRADAGQYPGLDLANDLAQLRNARLLVPLFVEEKLFALAALGQPAVNIDLGWEDFNILKVVGRQVGGYLALQHADRVLSESKQFRAMNQVSAFIVHDLKTVTAQLSLMLRNAEKHSSNPAFVADMLRTTDNAVARMNRLLAQLRETRQEPERSEVDLVAATREALASCERREPCPRFDAPREPVPVTADRERLVAAIGHIVKNAQEATPESGDVHVTIRQDGSWVAVEVTDTGCGMTPEFITKQLFTPFTTTKGLSGMGIGTYQAREYLRSLGGDVSVTSAPGRGTSFTLRLPSPAAVQLAGAPS